MTAVDHLTPAGRSWQVTGRIGPTGSGASCSLTVAEPLMHLESGTELIDNTDAASWAWLQ